MTVAFLHESEEIWFISPEPRPLEGLSEALLASGFLLDEDFFVIDREGKRPIWQSRSLTAAYVFLRESEIYDGAGETWDRVKLSYHLARLPASLIDSFVSVAAEVSSRLKLPMRFGGDVVDPEVLRARLREYAEELRQNLGEPGSKDVAIFIESTYPR